MILTSSLEHTYRKSTKIRFKKDILSNTDYNSLFTNSTKEDTNPKFTEEGLVYSFEDDKNMRTNKVVPQENIENFMNFNGQFDDYMCNQNNDFNRFLNNQNHALFEEETENFNTFKVKSDEQNFNEGTAQNINQIFSNVFSTDNNSVSSNNTSNVKVGENVNVKQMTNTLSNKRSREEVNKLNNKTLNKVLDTNNINRNVNFAVINSQNFASLFPNLNLLSQNTGVVNWVVPINNIANN